MKKILMIVFLVLFSFSISYANRDDLTTETYRSSSLVKTGQGKIFHITFETTAANGNFIIYDALSQPGQPGVELDSIVAEGGQGSGGNSIDIDYSAYPLEVRTGIYVLISNGYIVIRYQ